MPVCTPTPAAPGGNFAPLLGDFRPLEGRCALRENDGRLSPLNVPAQRWAASKETGSKPRRGVRLATDKRHRRYTGFESMTLITASRSQQGRGGLAEGRTAPCALPKAASSQKMTILASNQG